MAKIIQFKTQTDNVCEFLDKVSQEVQELKIDNMMIACKCKDGTVLTGYTKNLDVGSRQELLGHVQIDIINMVIKQNYITPN